MKFVHGEIFHPLESPMNKKYYFLFTVKKISCVQFSSCHTSDKNFLMSNFPKLRYVNLYVKFVMAIAKLICYSYITSRSRISLLLHETEGKALRSSVNNNDILRVLVI